MKKKYSLGWFLLFSSITIFSSSATTTPLGIASTTKTTTSSTTITTATKLTTFLGISSSTPVVLCATLRGTLSRRQESSDILTLQSFLSEKGFLQATPNGYFGVGTLASVKAFQKSKAIMQTGVVGKMTRDAIAKEICTRPLSQHVTPSLIVGSSSLPQVQATTSSSTKATTVATSTRISTPIATTIQQSVATSTSNVPVLLTPTSSSLRNTKRREHIGALLKALYVRYNDSRGTHPVSITDIPIELCVKPPSVIASGTSTEVAVLETPVSPCATFVDVSYLSPSYLLTIPRDPSLATTSMLLGYTITRSEYNDITIAAKNPEDKAILQAKCNFNSYCKDIKYISNIIYKKPVITSFSRSSFLRDSIPVTPITITGKNFTGNNSIKLISNYSSKEYFLGYASSTDGVTVAITPSMLNQLFPCGATCNEKLPLGEFSISVTNEGGESNNFYITLQGFTTSTVSSHNDTSIIPNSTSVKVAEITLGTAVTLGIQSLVLTSTSSVGTLPPVVKNFVLKEHSTGQARATGGTTLTFSDERIYENNSKVYDLYVDVGEVLAGYGGFITYGGYFLATDPFFSLDMNIPIKEFSFSVSY